MQKRIWHIAWARIRSVDHVSMNMSERWCVKGSAVLKEGGGQKKTCTTSIKRFRPEQFLSQNYGDTGTHEQIKKAK